MSKATATKTCELFTRGRKANKKTTNLQDTTETEAKATEATEDNTDASMANIGEVLSEIKSMRSDFRGRLDCIDQSLGNMSSTLTALENGLTQTKQDVTANTTRIAEAEARIAAAEAKQDEADTTLQLAGKRIAFLETKIEDLENRGRRKNLRVFGICEGIEGGRPLIDYMTDMLPKWLGLTSRTFVLERVHRTLATARPGQNRAVLIRFLSFQDKEYVYREARKQQLTHEGQKITFAQDFSAETARIRKSFHPLIKDFIDINAFRGFQYNPCRLRILHGGKIHLFSGPKEAEDFYIQVNK
ncbi:unnamed protein product [Knipowitschia caucasica]|uniref:LINE-1 type transposase domain-containing protein 1 n=1 Tax=Knipowitschia caucasica TaxID=637954 RepID=A0AAV2ME62_KNICA